jgi:hypothetical protein
VSERVTQASHALATLDAPEDVPYEAKRDKEGKLIVSDASKAQGKAIYDRAVANEPALTKMLADLVGDDDPENYSGPSETAGDLYGWKYRLKAESGIAEKIERARADEGLTQDEAGKSIKDANRYTVHFPEDRLGVEAQRIVDAINEDPNTSRIVVKNTWPPELNRAYKGINVNIWTKDGGVYEVQFHTPKSQAVKDTMHQLYEDQRTKTTHGSPEWWEYENKMTGMTRTLPMPTGAADVRTPSKPAAGAPNPTSEQHVQYEEARVRLPSG